MSVDKQIKALCRMAVIDGMVNRFNNNPKTRRKEIVEAAKYVFAT